MTAVDLAALDKLRGAATAGPWDVRWQCPEEAHHHDWDEGWVADPEGATVAVVAERYTNAPTDAALIVATVNALPELIAEARKYRALRKAVEGLAERYDRPATPDGMRALYGGGQVCYDLRAVVATVDGGS